MRFLLINQAFYPDVVATSQYLTQLALALAERGHEVTVLTGRRGYDAPHLRFAKAETWHGIRILRVSATALGKTAKWRRAVDFASFLGAAALRLASLPRHDVVLALTSPPLVSVLGALFARLTKARFYYWIMDFNPDEAIAAGWLKPGSPGARLLEFASRYSLGTAHRVIALDRFMRHRIVAKGIPATRIATLPPWSHDDVIRFDANGRESFRQRHGLQTQFVVMYSGNHSPCHPLTTLIEAARALRHDPRITFCFVGGGSEFEKLQQLSKKPEGSNLRCLPYQPTADLSASLSAADLHVVSMGEPFVGLIHPCKIYNILAVGAPVLCLTPTPSHLSEICGELPPAYPREVAAHGDVHRVISFIRNLTQPAPHSRIPLAHNRFSKDSILGEFVRLLEDPQRCSAA